MRKKEFKNSNICRICQDELTDVEVRDHCQITGKYRGPAHQSCNLNYKLPSFIPVFLHNNAHDNTHLFMHELSKTSGYISAIPNTAQNDISFTKSNFNKAQNSY